MNTLIELYDERPIENVMGTEVFRPKRTVFLCPREIAQNERYQKKLKAYFDHLGVDVELVFLETELFDSGRVLAQLRAVLKRYDDCALDISGGSDAALFACGALCAETNTPAFTYSRRRNCFYNIQNAKFADRLPCTILHSVEDCFLMAGGAMRGGRVDNSILRDYLDGFDAFFQIYMKHRARWIYIVQYFQKTSQPNGGERISLQVEAAFSVRGERNQKIDAPAECLRDLEKIGYLKDVVVEQDRVAYSFRDPQVRAWLRDVGSVLELYVYKSCLDANVFNDVYTSAVVDWSGGFQRDDVTNEIDVMAMKGTRPIFISCKTCPITTEALNELAILRDRFGGHGATAAIVTTQPCRSVTRHRASELRIEVIDVNDLKENRITAQIRSMIK